MNYLKNYFKKRKGMLALVLVLLIGQVVGTLLVPYLIADLIDVGIVEADMTAIVKIGIQMLFVALLTAIVAVAGSYFCADIGAALGRELRKQLFIKTQDLSIKEFDAFGTSSMITRTTSDVTNVQQTTVMLLQLVIPAPMIVVASSAMTWVAKPVLTLIPLLAIALFALIATFVMKKSSILSQRMQRRMDKINLVVRESIIGMRVIRAFDNAGYEKNRNDTAFSKYAQTVISINKLFAVLNPTVWLVMGLSMAAIVWFGGIFTANDTMALGQITAVTEYTIMTLGYLVMAAFSVVTLPKMLTSLRRLSAVLDTQPEIKDSTTPLVIEDTQLAQIEFEHVTFSYHGAEMPVLKDLTFTCEAGKTTAIIGGTGSGKSTIAGVLLRLFDIDKGVIRLSGIDIRDLSQTQLRNQIAYVPQKAFLFSGTIADNLRMGNKTATFAQMRHAAATAQAEAFIDALPLGFESLVVQGGANFSGGQKQRVSIARALIKNAPILVFDDSFSALDYQTDMALRRALRKEAKNAVTIIIAQRISTIMDADQIIVLEDGHIAGIGSHEKLMLSCSVYQEIAQSQLSQEGEMTHEA